MKLTQLNKLKPGALLRAVNSRKANQNPILIDCEKNGFSTIPTNSIVMLLEERRAETSDGFCVYTKVLCSKGIAYIGTHYLQKI